MADDSNSLSSRFPRSRLHFLFSVFLLSFFVVGLLKIELEIEAEAALPGPTF